MKRERWGFKLVTTIFAVLLLPAIAGADVFMKEKQHTDGMTIMGQAQPPHDTIATVWISKDKMRRDLGNTSSIAWVEKDKLVIYQLNHGNKTYTEFSLGSGDVQEMASAMAGELKVKVTPTTEKKKIGQWNCTKYLQEMDLGMMPMTSEIWASEDIKIPFQELYEKLSMAMTAQPPGSQKSMEAMQAETKKIKGVPVLTLTTTTMMKNVTMKTSRELLEVREEAAPAGIFDLPPGYTQQTLPQAMGERRKPGKQKP